MSLARTIQNGQVSHLDLEGCVIADESIPLRELLLLMRRNNRTTALLTQDERIAGIFTERDVLQKVLLAEPHRLDHPARELMTPQPTTVGAAVNILGALRLMNEGHFRDLPVVDEQGRLAGNLTDNAIVRHLCDHLPAEVLNLPPNPNQVARTVEGS